MYLILISTTVGVLTGVAAHLAFGGWVLAVLLAFVAMVVCQIVIGRRFVKQIQPAMEKVKRQAEAQHLDAAIQTLQDLLPLGRWVPLLEGQVHAQIGVLAHHTGKKALAIESLKKGSLRAGEAQLLLASLYERDGKLDQMRALLDRAAPKQKKSAFYHNVHAYLLAKHKDTAGAIARLAKYVARDATSEVSKDNLLRLQNGKKMNMKSFGMPWYMLGYERPPQAMGQMQTARKGFRQPPKSKRKAK